MDSVPGKFKILIVDDNPRNLYSFQTILGTPDLEMLTATSGEEALRLLLEHPDTSLILMDVQMPGMDGFEATELIRGQPRFRDIPILFITAVYRDDEFARHGFDIGAFDYVTKPVDAALIKSKVNVFLTLQGQRRQLIQSRDELERRVQERTAELTQANETLRTELAERVRVEDALRKSEARLAEAQRIAHIGNWEWNLQTDDVLWSDEVYRIFGVPLQEPSYELAQSLVHSDDVELWQSSMKASMEEDAPLRIDYRAVRPDGTLVWIRNEAEILRDRDGNPVRMVGITQDITERKRAEEEIRQLNSELEQRVRKRTAELRKLVNAMAGREVRMAELKDVIRKLRAQLEEAGLTPAADDPLLADSQPDT
jgi:PAS domain S-box-containing protein